MTTKTENKGVTVTVKQEIPLARIDDLLCCAFEGGISYWARNLRQKWVEGAEYSHQLPTRGGSVTLGDASGEDWPANARPILNLAAIKRGLQVMATKYPSHFLNFYRENEDAATGDVFVQCCVFGEVVFG